MLQSDRRKDPYPLTWEIPLGIFVVWAFLALVGVHLGRAFANLTTGRGWTWPDSRRLFTSVPGVLAGDSTAGLSSPAGGAPAAGVLGWVIGVEVLIVVTLTVTAVWVLRRWGPGRMKGMASPAEAEATLGVTRLRRVSAIIRPDLVGASKTTATTGWRPIELAETTWRRGEQR